MRLHKARRLARALLALSVGVILAATLPPVAGAAVTAYPKPSFTKTAGNATFAFHWTNDFPGELYYLCGDVFVNGVDVDPSEYILGAGSPNCSEAMTATSGDWVVQPFEPSTILEDGTTYDTCVFGVDYFDGVDYPGLPDCVSTTIDRDTPTLQVVLGGGAASTQSLAIPVQINSTAAQSVRPGRVRADWRLTGTATTSARRARPRGNQTPHVPILPTAPVPQRRSVARSTFRPRRPTGPTTSACRRPTPPYLTTRTAPINSRTRRLTTPTCPRRHAVISC